MQQTIFSLKRGSRDYPILLAETHSPPAVLYCRGNAELLKMPRLVAIVGTRKASSYGKRVVQDIVDCCVQHDVVTVSGLALGIDGCVHRETLHRGGKTIAVLGAAVNSREIIPRTHERLAQEIVDAGGLLVSEYPSGTEVKSFHFPQRNRIIAGLAHATVVVEAPLKSGSLITARYALNENRDVFAVPGSLYSPFSVGTHDLIMRGAIPWISCQSFCDALQYETSSVLKGSTQQRSFAFDSLSKKERCIISCIAKEPCTIDELIEATALPPAEVLACIHILSMKGMVQKADHYRYMCS